MYDVSRMVALCSKFTWINSHLCDYGRQVAVIAAIALQKSRDSVIHTTLNLTGDPLPVTIHTMGDLDIVDGMPGQLFIMEIQGHRQHLQAEFYLNPHSIHEVLRLEAEIAMMLKDYFLPRDLLDLIERTHYQGITEDIRRDMACPETMKNMVRHFQAKEMMEALLAELLQF